MNSLLIIFPLIHSSISLPLSTKPSSFKTSPSEFSRLFDQLSFIVNSEYSTSLVSHNDDIEIINETVHNPSILSVNSQVSRRPLFQGDIRLTVNDLQDMIDGLLDGVEEEEVDEGGSGEVEEDEEWNIEEWSGMEGSGDATRVEEGSGERTKRVGKRRRKREAVKGIDVRWNNATVHYAFDPFLSLNARTLIDKAIKFWQRETCITFASRFLEKDFLYFIAADGCWSTVGRDPLQGQQWLSLARGCEEYGIVVHEIGHALGLFHEQSRFDRDKHVQVDLMRIKLGYSFQFTKVPPSQLSTYGLPYDVGSVMHYAPNEFSAFPSLPALRAKDPYLQSSMGQLGGPSFLDIATLNIHYKCKFRCSNKIHCSNRGYQDPNDCDLCKCPTGFGGKDCRSVESPSIVSCGGELKATKNWRQLKIHIKENLERTSERRCIYQILSPVESLRVEIIVKDLEMSCNHGCWKEAMEVKARPDPRPVGYRFCCPRLIGTSIYSYRRRLPLMVYSRGRTARMAIHYRYVVNGTVEEERSHRHTHNSQRGFGRMKRETTEDIRIMTGEVEILDEYVD